MTSTGFSSPVLEPGEELAEHQLDVTRSAPFAFCVTLRQHIEKGAGVCKIRGRIGIHGFETQPGRFEPTGHRQRAKRSERLFEHNTHAPQSFAITGFAGGELNLIRKSLPRQLIGTARRKLR